MIVFLGHIVLRYFGLFVLLYAVSRHYQAGGGSFPEESAPIFFCLDKRKRPRPVKRKPPGQEAGPEGRPLVNAGIVRIGPARIDGPVGPAPDSGV